VIWGYAAHPQIVGSQLWTPVRIPWVPRGIFGPDSETGWQPARETPRPTFYYLPDIRANWYDWNSYIVVQNLRSDLTLAVDIALYNQNGTFNKWWLNPDNSPVRLAPRASRTIAVADRFPGSSFNGSAVIAASQDVAVVVENQYGTSRSYAYNGIAASDSLNPGWGQVGTTLYAPVIMRNYYGWDSGLILLNAGSATASGNIEYYGPNGTTPVHTVPFSLSPNGSFSTTYYGGAANTLYSARIVSAQPLAAVGIQHKSDATVYLAYNCLSAGASPVYAPVIMNNYYGWDTSVNIQNTSASSATVYVRYYDPSGNQVVPTKEVPIPPYASRSRYSPSEGLPDPFIGTARITSTQPVAVVVNQSYPRGGSTTRGQSYDGVSSGRPYVVLPDVLNYYGSENEKWVTSVNVQNLSTSSSTNVTLTYQSQSVESPPRHQAKGHLLFLRAVLLGGDPQPWASHRFSRPAGGGRGEPVRCHLPYKGPGPLVQWLQPIACHCAVEWSKRPVDNSAGLLFCGHWCAVLPVAMRQADGRSTSAILSILPTCGIILDVGSFTFHVSRFTFHVSRFTFHVSRLTF